MADDAKPWRAYLVQHIDDLYPVTAYWTGEDWRYQQDGPEDIQEPGDFKHSQMKRAPTHIRELPEGPQYTDDGRNA